MLFDYKIDPSYKGSYRIDDVRFKSCLSKGCLKENHFNPFIPLNYRLNVVKLKT